MCLIRGHRWCVVRSAHYRNGRNPDFHGRDAGVRRRAIWAGISGFRIVDGGVVETDQQAGDLERAGRSGMDLGSPVCAQEPTFN